MKLTDIGTVKELMGENAFQKRFGQNFLIREAIPIRIAEAGAARGILEIGPGIGTLTRELCARAEKVVAVEIDRRLLPILEKTLADFSNVEVVEGDILKTDLSALVAEKFFGASPASPENPFPAGVTALAEGEETFEIAVCANLPYYITSPVLMKLLESKVPFCRITVMIQKEVAARLTAPAGSEAYGALTAAVCYYAAVRKLFDVPAGCFLPRPKVDSAVVQLIPHKTPPVKTDKTLLFTVIRGAFAQRRKTLANALSAVLPLPRDLLSEKIASCGYPAGIRGEALDLTGFSRIADALAPHLGAPIQT